MRQVYMVLSPRSLGYAAAAIESLFCNSLEKLDVRFITDSKADTRELTDAVAKIASDRHLWTVYSKDDLADREETVFAGYGHLRAFRRGHPCWRKITDPMQMPLPRETSWSQMKEVCFNA